MSPTAETAAAKFDKAKWVASLTDEQRQLLKLEIDTLDESWLAQLKAEITSKEFLELKKFLDREAKAGKKVFPPKEDVYSWYVPQIPSIPPHIKLQSCLQAPPGPATPPSTRSKS